MNHFQFAQFFLERRKQMGVTQEEVANYVGVSKAAISKWEKGQSYPDIALLPRLATYFNSSIDELLGYEPQLTTRKISEIYQMFLAQLNVQSFEQVQEEVERYIKEYYACFPFLLKMALLYLNYYKKAEQPEAVLARVDALCERVKMSSTERNMKLEATHLQTFVKMLENKPDDMLELIGQEPKLLLGEEIFIAKAYLMKGKQEKAKEVLNVMHYQHFFMLIAIATESLLNDFERFDETVKRTLALIDLYNVEVLNCNTALVFYVHAAIGYMMTNRPSEALAMLERYVKCCSKLVFPLRLQQDDFFYTIESWMLKQANMDFRAPRSDEAIKADMITTLTEQPIFAPLQQQDKFQILVSDLKHRLQ